MSFVSSVENELKWLRGRDIQSTHKILRFLAQNPRIEQWLEPYEEDGEIIRIDYEKIYDIDLSKNKNVLTIVCHPAICFELWKREKQLLRSTQLLLKIIEKRQNGRMEVYATSSTHPKSVRELECSSILSRNMLATENNSSRSGWVTSSESNRMALGSFIKEATVTIHSEEDGYEYKFIQPLLGIEAVLCKPIAQLIGTSASEATGVIGEKREAVISKAIESGGSASETYTFEWRNVTWRKIMTAIYLPGHNEVLVQTSHARGEDWQIGYWSNWVGGVDE